MNAAQIVRMIQLKLRETLGEEADYEAKVMVADILGIEPKALPMHYGMELMDEQIEELGTYVARRAQGEPLQYIIGQWSFMGLPFIVDARALIPRQDTEMLCEIALSLAQERGYQTVLDLCCGTGCIGIALAVLGKLSVTVSDISSDCIALAKENAEINDAEVTPIVGDLFENVREAFDMIVCNPPYLTKSDMETLQTEVSYEPSDALYGGADGLDYYRRIAREYAPYLKDGGALLLEIGATQADAVTALFDRAEVRHDYCGNPRVVIVEKP